jgi:hypothetical protein
VILSIPEFDPNFNGLTGTKGQAVVIVVVFIGCWVLYTVEFRDEGGEGIKMDVDGDNEYGIEEKQGCWNVLLIGDICLYSANLLKLDLILMNLFLFNFFSLLNISSESLFNSFRRASFSFFKLSILSMSFTNLSSPPKITDFIQFLN